MGIGKTELTLAQLAAYKYQNVNFVNVPGGDLLYTVVGHPNLVIINIGELLNIAAGEIQGDAVAIDELTATQIAAGAVDTSELAAGCLAASIAGRAKFASGVFDAATALDKIASAALVGSLIPDDAVGMFANPTAVPIDHADGSPADLLAADASNDRLCLVMAVATETAAGNPEFDVGSETTATNGMFDDLSAGAWVIGERWVGAIMLPATEKLQVTINAAGTAGAISFYVIPLTVTHADASIADAKLASSLVKDPGTYANAIMRQSGVYIDGETYTIGSDVFEVDPIQTDLGDDTQGGEWNNVTDPLTVDINVGNYPNLQGVLVVGELILITNEYMRVTAISGGAGDEVTFERGAGGSTIAVHADAINILTSAGTPAPTNIPIGVAAALAAATVTPIFAATIMEDAGTAGQANAVNAASLSAGAVLLLTAEAVGAVALATTETGTNSAFDFTAMRYGAAATVRQVYSRAIVPDSEEVTANEIIIPLPFDPVAISVQIVNTATGVILAWDGDLQVVVASAPTPAYIIINNDAAVDWDANDTIRVIAFN